MPLFSALILSFLTAALTLPVFSKSVLNRLSAVHKLYFFPQFLLLKTFAA